MSAISREEALAALESARRVHWRRNVHSKAVALKEAQDIPTWPKSGDDSSSRARKPLEKMLSPRHL